MGRYRKGNIIKIIDSNTAVIYTSKGEAILIDKGDIDKLKEYTWCIAHGYAVTSIDRKTVGMHRLIMNAPKEKDVDHINRNRADNRKSNLRICTRSQNGMNRNPGKNNKSGVNGVSKFGDKWRASIGINNKIHHLGIYDKKEDAILARKIVEPVYFAAAREL